MVASLAGDSGAEFTDLIGPRVGFDGMAALAKLLPIDNILEKRLSKLATVCSMLMSV
jgi:hypothetical protein